MIFPADQKQDGVPAGEGVETVFSMSKASLVLTLIETPMSPSDRHNQVAPGAGSKLWLQQVISTLDIVVTCRWE